MKILKLSASNIKKLVAVEITPDGNIVKITGKNGEGKTSVLDCIWWALAGKDSVQKMPIRNGQESAEIRLDLGDIIVTRHFKKKDANEFTSRITVESQDGAQYKSPQNMLDDLIGEISFDPLAFMNMDQMRQAELLQSFVPDVDFVKFEAEQKRDYDARRDINRDIKSLEAVISGIPVNPDVSTDIIDVQKILADIEIANKHNNDIVTRGNNRQKMADEIDSQKKLIKTTQESNAVAVKEVERDIEALQAKLQRLLDGGIETVKRIEHDIAEKQQKLDSAPPLPAPIDITEFQDKLASAEAVNTNARNFQSKQAQTTKLEAMQNKSDALTRVMKARQDVKAEAISRANLPVKGLEFGSAESAAPVLLNGVPLNQASMAEKLRASMGIAMAMNPKIPGSVQIQKSDSAHFLRLSLSTLHFISAFFNWTICTAISPYVVGSRPGNGQSAIRYAGG